MVCKICGEPKYVDNSDTITQNEKYKLVRVKNGTRYPYQINNTKDINSDEWFCYGAWETLHEALDEFEKNFNK